MTEETGPDQGNEPLGPVEAAARAARALLDDRVGAVRELAQAQVDVDSARRTLELVERGHAAAYRSAIRAGWSEGQLRKVGYPPPARKAPGRPAQPAPAREPQDPGGGGPVAN